MTFDARFVSTVPEEGGLGTTTGTFSAQGTYDQSGTNGPRVDTAHCEFAAPDRPDLSSGFSAKPVVAGASLEGLVDQMVSRTGGCSSRPSAYLGLNACGTSGCVGVCEVDYASGRQGDFERFQRATSPVESEYPRTGSKTTNYDVTLDPSGRCYDGTQSVTLSIQAAFTLGGGGARTPARRPSPPRPRLTRDQATAKAAALETMQDAWFKAMTACSGTAAFTILFAAGPAGEVVGSVLVPASAYQCAAWVEMVNDAADTFKDPPLPSDEVIARVAPAAPAPRLPACSDPLCARTRAAALAAIAADRRTAAVAHAIELTISRLSHAQSHHHTRAAAKQDRALHTLNAQLARARRAESAAGRALAGVVTGAGLAVTRDAGQATTQIATLVSRLARQGLPRAKIAAIDARLLTPQPGDWLAALGTG